MAIPVEQFQPESFAQANPFLSGVQIGQGIMQQGIQNAFLAPTLQQNLTRAQLTNQILQPQAQYAPQLTLADLAYKQAMAPNLQAQTQEITQGKIPLEQAQAAGVYQGTIPLERAEAAESYAKVPLYGAQTQLTQAQVPWVGTNALGKLYGGMGSFLRNSPIANVIKMQNSPAFQQLVAGNPQAQANYAAMIQSQLNNQAVLPSLPGAQSVLPQGSMPPGASILQGMPQQQNAPISATPELAASQNGITTPFGTASSADAANIGNVLNNKLMQTYFSPQQIQQITYDNSVQNMLKQTQPQLDSIAKYGGVGGLARLAADKSKAASGIDPGQDYANYVNFTRVQAPLISNELRRAFGAQATDQESKLLSEISNPIAWDRNPSMMYSQMNSLVSAIHANTAAITQPKFTNLQQAQQSIAQPSSSGMVRIKMPDGNLYDVPSSKVDAIQQKYPDAKVL